MSKDNSITVAVKAALTPAESTRLVELEVIVERGLAGFVEVGTALLEISDRRLYRQTHSTFAEYVEDKWKISVRQAYRLCESAELVRSLPAECDQLVTNESQARELARVPEPERKAVIEMAQGPDGTLTAKAIREAASQTEQPLRCNSCGETFKDDSDAEPIYECADCGERFTSENSADGEGNRCPSCNKFGCKVTDVGCPSCGEGELVPDADRPAVVAHVEVMPPEPTTNGVEGARDSFRTWLAQWGNRNRSKVLAIVREVIDEEPAS